MATNIFLGYPPENIKNWIIENYGPKEDPMLKTPLHFTANEDNSSVSLVCYDDDECEFMDSWCELEYSMSGKDNDWDNYETEQVINLNKDETVYFRAKQGNIEGNPNLNGFGYFSSFINNDGDEEYVTKYHYFIMEGSIRANGNIQFLLENTGTKMDVPKDGYSSLFFDINNQRSTVLTQAPLLPATILGNNCYMSMFNGCAALTQAPELPATTLVESCYERMFKGCAALNSINVNFSAWDPADATYYWLNSVSTTGTFTCPTELEEKRGISNIPKNWTIVRK